MYKKVTSCRERPVRKQGGNESTLNYPATEYGEKERQGLLVVKKMHKQVYNRLNAAAFINFSN